MTLHQYTSEKKVPGNTPAFLLEEVPLTLTDLEAFFLEDESTATFLNFGPEDIFKALAGTRLPFINED